MREQETLLQVKKLCVDFVTRRGTIRVVDHISFHLRQGECLGIVGESGCGKTMTALAVLRLVPPPGRISEGKILLRGHDLLPLPEERVRDVRGKEISMIFQEPMTALNPVFTIGMQIAESVQTHEGASRKEAMRRAIEMLRAVGISPAEKRVNQYPHELSGGMRQRAMIAMALCCRPSVLIADEPTTALDVTVQAQIFDLLLDIQNKMGTALILITHDMAVIAEVAQRIVVMYAGRKMEEGPTDAIIRDPRHPYTQGLLRCVPRLRADPGPDPEDLMEIPGMVPHLNRLGIGCPFYDRCDYVTIQCSDHIVPTIEVGENHRVTCRRAEAVP